MEWIQIFGTTKSFADRWSWEEWIPWKTGVVETISFAGSCSSHLPRVKSTLLKLSFLWRRTWFLSFLSLSAPSNLLSPCKWSFFPSLSQIRAIKVYINCLMLRTLSTSQALEAWDPTEEDWSDAHLAGIAIHSSCLLHSHTHIFFLSLCNTGLVSMWEETSL